jgi:chemotaxis protein CheX
MERMERDDIVKTIHGATESVFSTMLNLSLEPQAARRETGDSEPRDGVVALVGIAGSWTGTGQIYCSANFACQLAGALLMAEYPSVDSDVLDAVSEVANMIIGNVKTTLEESLGPLGLGIPTVIYGRNYQARTGSVHDWTVVPFRCGEESLEIRFCLMPASTSTRPVHARTEPVLA